MSADQFRDVDLDLLADYVGGALEGTPEQARVARLIAEDPAWAQAHAELVVATDAVQADLAAWGRGAEPMPPEVVERLTAVLAAPEQAAPGGHAARRLPKARTPERVSVGATPRPARPGPGRPTRAVRRWRRWAAPAALAAGVAALAALGIGHVFGDGRGGSTALRGDDEPTSAVATAEVPETMLPAPQPARVTSSGSDYTVATLPAGSDTATPDDSPQPMVAGEVFAHPSLADVPSALRPLTEPDALAACLRAVSVAHGGGPLAVDLVDFAAFQGAPALVVTFTDAAGERWVWVAGPGCGRSGTGPDTRYATRVG